MFDPRPAADLPLADRLLAAGVRPTAQRLCIAAVLLERPQHLSADEVLSRARVRQHLSKATVYNTLRLFAERGLIRAVVVDPDRVFFDSTPSPHHHLFDEDTHRLTDIPGDQVSVVGLPPVPAGTEAVAIEVVVRVRAKR